MSSNTHENFQPTQIQVWVEKGQCTTLQDVVDNGIIYTTTADFPYDMVRGTFCRETEWIGEIRGVLVDADYSQYEPNKCSTGGCYGFETYKIITGDDHE